MPIYSYRCEDCGHAQDVLQKMSDPPLTVCPSCGHATFRKQVTAAGFQLKGSGWYVTDFRNGQAGKAPAKDESKPETADATPATSGADAATTSTDKPATPSPTPVPAPAPADKPGASAKITPSAAS